MSNNSDHLNTAMDIITYIICFHYLMSEMHYFLSKLCTMLAIHLSKES